MRSSFVTANGSLTQLMSSRGFFLSVTLCSFTTAIFHLSHTQTHTQRIHTVWVIDHFNMYHSWFTSARSDFPQSTRCNIKNINQWSRMKPNEDRKHWGGERSQWYIMYAHQRIRSGQNPIKKNSGKSDYDLLCLSTLIPTGYTSLSSIPTTQAFILLMKEYNRW